jgi:5,10-methylenetetrahydromethanopterin reductase
VPLKNRKEEITLVEFGIEFVPQNPFWKTTYYAIQAEKTGFDSLWITDHYNNRNVYVSLTTIAIYTERIKLGPGVTNPYLIHPVITAQAVSSLNEIAPGRVVCGIGVGDKTTLDTLKIEQKVPIATIKEAVQIIREMTSGKTVKIDGKVFSVKGARFFFQVQDPIPIFIGAQGPKMLSLAAQIGDGVLINASHPSDIKNALNFIKKGVEKASKRLEELKIAAYTSFSISEDVKEAIKAVTPVVAFIVAGSPESLLNAHGIPIEIAKEIREALSKASWKEAFSKVTPEMIEAFSICGKPETCIEKIDALLKIGVNQFVVGSPIGLEVHKSIKLIGERILPYFKK